MITFSNTLTIGREVGDVYGYLVDLERIPEWNWAITRTRKVSSGPVRPGTRYEQTRHTPRHAVEEIEVVGLDPGRRLHLRGTLGPYRADLRYELEPDGPATRLVNHVTLEPTFRPLDLPLLRRGISKAVSANLHALRSLLEAEPPAPGRGEG